MVADQELVNLAIPSDKIDEQKVAAQVLEDFTKIMADRVTWQNRRKQWATHWDDFVTKHTKPAFKGGSTFHIPLTFAQMKAIKAKLLRGLFQLNPPFHVRPVEKADVDRVDTVRLLMDYVLKNYINNYKGIFPEAANWLQDMIIEGFSIAKVRWERIVRKYKDVEEVEIIDSVPLPDINGQSVFVPKIRKELQEVEKEEVVFDGPIFETIPLDDFFMPKNGTDLDDTDQVIHRLWMSSSDLRQKADMGFFKKTIVKEILDKENDEGTLRRGTMQDRPLEATKDHLEGLKSLNAMANRPKHEILEWYGRYDVNNDGIDEEVVFWVHKDRGKLLRWTYLDRIFKSGRRPFFKVDFMPKSRNLYSLGLVEMMYPLNVEIDAMHNMRVDCGKFLIPWGVFRGASGIKPDEIKIQPGVLFPVDDVQRDIRLMEMPNAGILFAAREEEALLRHAERLVSISDLQFGRVSEVQSSTRTAFGVATLKEEANIQIDMLLRQVYYAWGQVLKAIFQLLQSNLPLGFVLRVTGDLGQNIFHTIQSREEIRGSYDFEISANSSQLNREVSRQNLLQAFQLGMNPLLLQLGITSPKNIFNMLVALYKAYDITEIEKYATSPESAPQPINPLDAIGMIAQGIMPPVLLLDNHVLAIETAQRYLQEPNFQAVAAQNPAVLSIMQAYIQAHQQMQTIIEAQAQMQNVTGLQISPNLASKLAAGNAGVSDNARQSSLNRPRAGKIPGEEPNQNFNVPD